MSVSLQEFTKRAQEAEDKLRSLESQINALASTSLRSKSEQKYDEKESSDEWEVIYWPVKNRGNFVKLVFEEAGVNYKNTSDMNEMKSQIRSNMFGTQKYEDGGAYQAMAPPLIKNGNFMLSQSIVCMGYLSDKFGIRPKRNEDNARAQMLANNCSDLISEIYQHREKPKDELFKFINTRFQIWLDLFEKPLKKNNLQFYFDNKCTQADLAVFNALDGIQELFGNDSFNKFVIDTHPFLNKYYNNLKQRDSIKRLMTKQTGQYSYAPAFGWDKCRKIFRGEDGILTFKSDEIIPDVVDTEPLELLVMEYKLGDMSFELAEMGQTLTPMQVQDAPCNLKFKGCDIDKLYTIILTDPDAKDRKKHEFREWVHYVRINVGGSDLSVSGDIIIEYVGSGPPPNTGLHRYCWLIYEQVNGKIDVDKCGQKKLI
eukprot:378653_1